MIKQDQVKPICFNLIIIKLVNTIKIILTCRKKDNLRKVKFYQFQKCNSLK